MLGKDFDSWNELKKKLEKNKPPLFNEREVWFVYNGNLGHEIDGKPKLFLRPALVVKKYNKDLFLGVFLSSKVKEGEFYLNIGKVAGKDSIVLLSQIRTLSAKRLAYKIHKVSSVAFESIKERLISLNLKQITPLPDK